MLFNDYFITPVAEKNVAVYDSSWKNPCLLYFAKGGYRDHYHDQGMSDVDNLSLAMQVEFI